MGKLGLPHLLSAIAIVFFVYAVAVKEPMPEVKPPPEPVVKVAEPLLFIGELVITQQTDEFTVLVLDSIVEVDRMKMFIVHADQDNFSIGDTYTVDYSEGDKVHHIWLGEPSGNLDELELVYDD